MVETPDAPATVEEEAPPVAPPMPPSTADDLRAWSRGVEGLAWRLAPRVTDRPGNRVFSPAATAVAFAMTASLDGGPAGAQGLRALSPTLGADALHRASGTALRRWQGALGERSGLLAVQRVFVDRAVRLDDTVSERLRSVYGAPVGVVDTGGPEGARRRIDGFLHARTQGLVPEAIPEHAIVADGPAVVASAAFARFSCAGAITTASFSVGGVSPSQTRAVRCASGLQRARGVDFTLWRVASADGSSVLDVVVPDASVRLRTLEARLDEAAVSAVVAALGPVRGAIVVPTVRISNDAPSGFRNTLMEMDLGDLFDPERSSLARVSRGGRWVSELYHRARFELDAVEATSDRAVEVTAIDRPFLFVLRDARLGVALAIGHVVDPGR